MRIATGFVLDLLRGHTRTFAGRQVHPNPGTITGQLSLTPRARKPNWLSPAQWDAIAGDAETVRWSGDQHIPELVVRRVDRTTARITDLDGHPYSDLMRIEDAIATLKEATT